jgi:hypothetical protein
MRHFADVPGQADAADWAGTQNHTQREGAECKTKQIRTMGEGHGQATAEAYAAPSPPNTRASEQYKGFPHKD